MVELTENGYEFHYDIDGMLYENMLWLADLTKEPAGKFAKVAKEMRLSNSDLEEFWKIVSGYRFESCQKTKLSKNKNEGKN